MRLSGFQLPVERISASSLARAIQCPEQFRRKDVLKQKERMWGDRFIGIADHETWERFFYAKQNGLPPIDLEAVYRECWEFLLSREGEVDWGDEQPEKVYKRSLAMLRTYLPHAEKIEPLAVEEWIELDVGVGVPVVGKIDIREAGRIVDRKTSGSRLSKPKSRWRLQARLYQLAYPLPFDWHIITKQVTPQVVTPEEAPLLRFPVANADVTVGMIRHAVARLSDYYARYGADTAWPMDGLMGDWACDYCSFGPKYERSCAAWL